MGTKRVTYQIDLEALTLVGVARRCALETVFFSKIKENVLARLGRAPEL